ncbi:MAG: NAD(P)/FAD-dependent oxidoreductase [Burkholderiales bacterium]|nr:NAD(P)/FAD-dependent oxidoreductase [Burkholderiales bacterium]
MAESVECVVIGAGVVGLAVARALAQKGLETVVVEAESGIGTGTSSRNSEVIHAGIYYPTGSLKARFCVAGKHALYRYCAEHGVTTHNCGKLIVATAEDQVEGLKGLVARGHANGVPDLRMLSRAEALAMEPALSCVTAVHSPSTGIVDSHAFMLALQGDLESAGGMLAFASPVLRGACRDDGITLEVGGETASEIRARVVVNSAGLAAPGLAGQLDGLADTHVPKAYFAKGNYYTLTGRSPFSRLIYPAPEAAGLGVHLTIDLGGQARFGPDVEWVESLDYTVDPRRADSFYAAIRAYWPQLPDGALAPGYAGIRPKLQAPGEPAYDFVIDGPQVHGVPGLINLFGIESPGLTSSLAIAEYVADML